MFSMFAEKDNRTYAARNTAIPGGSQQDAGVPRGNCVSPVYTFWLPALPPHAGWPLGKGSQFAEEVGKDWVAPHSGGDAHQVAAAVAAPRHLIGEDRAVFQDRRCPIAVEQPGDGGQIPNLL